MPQLPNTTCNCCKGQKSIVEKIQNLRSKEWRESIEVCPACNGKGVITQADLDANFESYRISSKTTLQ